MQTNPNIVLGLILLFLGTFGGLPFLRMKSTYSKLAGLGAAIFATLLGIVLFFIGVAQK